jgi:hypothetical protein
MATLSALQQIVKDGMEIQIPCRVPEPQLRLNMVSRSAEETSAL